MKKLSILLVFYFTSTSYSQINIPVELRVQNTDPSGTCWFCCANTLGNFLGILPLQDINKKVILTGIGHKTGATEESIDYWLKELNLKSLSNPIGKKDQEAVNKLTSWLGKGLPVIVSYTTNTGGSHAVLITHITKEKEVWSDTLNDYSITYIDPDNPTKHTTVNWQWFYGVWTGKAITFDPGEQNPSLLRKPGRLLLANNSKIIHKSPPIEVRKEMPPYYAHELPFRADMPAHNEKIKVFSNTELKDGVTRPSDIFESNYPYNYTNYNYYREYKEKK